VPPRRHRVCCTEVVRASSDPRSAGRKTTLMEERRCARERSTPREPSELSPAAPSGNPRLGAWIADRFEFPCHETRLALDYSSRWTHARSVKHLVASVTLGLVAFAAAALGDAIQKWQTPEGSWYFGDRPPKGSTLVETYADTPSLPVTAVSSDAAALSQAAAEGRDIIRRREAAREAERLADTARELRMAEIEASQIDGYGSAPFWFITGGVVPCRFGEPCGRDLRFPGGHVPHDMGNHFFPNDHFFLKNQFFPTSHFFPRNRFFPRNQLFRKNPFFPGMSSHLRSAPAPSQAPRRSFQMSARFGGRH
jgi:hypothetical protein